MDVYIVIRRHFRDVEVFLVRAPDDKTAIILGRDYSGGLVIPSRDDDAENEAAAEAELERLRSLTLEQLEVDEMETGYQNVRWSATEIKPDVWARFTREVPDWPETIGLLYS